MAREGIAMARIAVTREGVAMTDTRRTTDTHPTTGTCRTSVTRRMTAARRTPMPAVLTTVAALVLTALTSAAPLAAQTSEEPPYPSPEWTAREQENYAITTQAPSRQASDPDFLARWELQSQANFLAFLQRQAEDPDWVTAGNLCETWAQQCTGDPYRYPGVDPFYDEVGEVVPVAFLDRGGARLSGRVWMPKGTPPGAALPGVVIINGSVQAPETLYWWAAQALVRAGYMVLTFDPRGQGRSDNHTPDGEPGSNANPAVFVTNLIDAIDFLRSTPDAPYPPNQGDPRRTDPYNPLWDRLDHGRLGIVGHSLGATGVSVVQGIEPWPGSSGEGPDGSGNPVDVAVAWDNLRGSGSLAGYEVVPRVPTMGHSADYGLTPTPYDEPPDPDGKRQGFLAWQQAGLPTYQIVVRGGSHYEWSLVPTFPTSDWEPGGPGGWGRPMAEFYTLAWLDRWLKQPGEPGYEDADARLLAEDQHGPDGTGPEPDGATWRERMSFYYRSSRSFPDRSGTWHVCEDIRRGCPESSGAPNGGPAGGGNSGAPSGGESGGSEGGGPAAAPEPPAEAPPALPTTGGSAALWALALLGVAGWSTRGRIRRGDS